ncbi:hypothetical protein ACQZV8_09210 [Magnetococcales bacterium HHB-1]
MATTPTGMIGSALNLNNKVRGRPGNITSFGRQRVTLDPVRQALTRSIEARERELPVSNEFPYPTDPNDLARLRTRASAFAKGTLVEEVPTQKLIEDNLPYQVDDVTPGFYGLRQSMVANLSAASSAKNGLLTGGQRSAAGELYTKMQVGFYPEP